MHCAWLRRCSWSRWRAPTSRATWPRTQAILASLKQFFALDESEAKLLLAEARKEADHAVELQQFTRRLHEQLSMAEKHRVIEMLWEVAFADQHLDKHEDHLVGRLADLLYVSRSDLIRIRNRVRGDR